MAVSEMREMKEALSDETLDILLALGEKDQRKFMAELASALRLTSRSGDYRAVGKVVRSWREAVRARPEELMGDEWNGDQLVDALKRTEHDPDGGTSLSDYLQEATTVDRQTRRAR